MNGTGVGHDARSAPAEGSCGDIPAALTALADQVTALKARLAGATERVHWSGPAAAAFHDHAAARYGTLAELVRELTDAAAAAHSLQCLVGERAS